MLSIKISYNNEIRRVSVYSDNENFTFTNLVETAKTLFPSLRSTESLNIVWSDDEDDICSCSSDAELAEALRIMNGKTLRFTISLESNDKSKAAKSTTASTAVHPTVSCDGCGMKPLVGIRYKCTVRNDFDLCETCEAAQKQPYPMIKIYSDDQAPLGIFVAMKGECDTNVGRHPHGHHHGPPHHHGHHNQGHHGPPHGPNGPWGERPPWAGCNKQWGSRSGGGGGGCPRNQWKRDLMGLWCRPPSAAAAFASSNTDPNSKSSEEPFVAAANAFANSLKKSQASSVEHSNGSNSNSGGSTNGAEEPFTAAVNAFTEALFNEPNTPTEDQHVEQQLFDEAIRQSLQEPNAEGITEAKATFVPLPTAAANVDMTKSEYDVNSFFTKWAPPTASISTKPMARFIKDVTLPDGSAVVPGSTVVKTWRIRNDGSHVWPEGVTLSFASGDVLAASPKDLVYPISPLKPNEEVDVSVRLSIPETTGRHVTYFRLRTKEGNIFGQRVWVDLRVVEPDADWVGVKDATLGASSAASAVTATATSAASGDATASVTGGVSVVTSQSVLTTTKPMIVVPIKTVSASSHSAALAASAKEVFDAAAPPVNATAAAGVWTTVWSRELQVLADMGFTDSTALIPLLQEHVGLPVSLCPQLNGVPSAEGMQKLVAVLLNQSGTASASHA